MQNNEDYVRMEWRIEFTHKAAKQIKKLNISISRTLRFLLKSLQIKGPSAGCEWPHYGKLYARQNEDKRHCHLNKGHPTYVCCWKIQKTKKLIEVYYVGTHENAPY